MKQIHITLLASAAALIAGATAGYYYARKDINKKFDLFYDEVENYESKAFNSGYKAGRESLRQEYEENPRKGFIKGVREFKGEKSIPIPEGSKADKILYNNKVNDLSDGYEKARSEFEDKENEKTEVALTPKEEKDKNRVLYNQRINRLDYSKPSLSDIYDTLQLHPEDDEPEEDDEEAYEEPPIEQPRNEFIFQITPKEFFEEMNHYEKLTITYYEGDNTLADERDGVIPDANELLGTVPLTDDVTYIRNNRRSSDFEVVKVEEGYVEVVLGHRPVDEESFHVMRKKAHYGEI